MDVICEYLTLYKINENKRQHRFLYYKHKNDTLGSVADTGLPAIYWKEMRSLSLGEVTDSTSIVFL